MDEEAERGLIELMQQSETILRDIVVELRLLRKELHALRSVLALEPLRPAPSGKWPKWPLSALRSDAESRRLCDNTDRLITQIESGSLR
jgi:hypothetical protein